LRGYVFHLREEVRTERTGSQTPGREGITMKTILVKNMCPGKRKHEVVKVRFHYPRTLKEELRKEIWGTLMFSVVGVEKMGKLVRGEHEDKTVEHKLVTA
jgi:hypothetical protein